MPLFQPQQIKEINEVIEEIEKALKPKHEIGSQSKVILTNLLKTQKGKNKPVFFKTKREYSDQIISHFVNEKKLVKNKFHSNGAEYIYLV
jgi:hypothetical protein